MSIDAVNLLALLLADPVQVLLLFEILMPWVSCADDNA